MPTHRTNECHKYKTWRNVDVVASVVDDEEAEDDIIIFLLRRRRRLYRREKSEEFPHFLFATRSFDVFCETTFRAERLFARCCGAVQRAPGERVRAGRRV